MIIEAPIYNHYGRPQVRSEKGKFYFELDDYSGTDSVEVSKAFFDAWVNQFGQGQMKEMG